MLRHEVVVHLLLYATLDVLLSHLDCLFHEVLNHFADGSLDGSASGFGIGGHGGEGLSDVGTEVLNGLREGGHLIDLGLEVIAEFVVVVGLRIPHGFFLVGDNLL